jgi:hypothetical protein
VWYWSEINRKSMSDQFVDLILGNLSKFQAKAGPNNRLQNFPSRTRATHTSNLTLAHGPLNTPAKLAKTRGLLKIARQTRLGNYRRSKRACHNAY